MAPASKARTIGMGGWCEMCKLCAAPAVHTKNVNITPTSVRLCFFIYPSIKRPAYTSGGLPILQIQLSQSGPRNEKRYLGICRDSTLHPTNQNGSPLRKGLYVFCQADRYQQPFLLDEKGEVVSRDIPKVLGAIKCGPETPTAKTPSDYNAAVMRVKRQFTEEVKHREAEREHTVSDPRAAIRVA